MSFEDTSKNLFNSASARMPKAQKTTRKEKGDAPYGKKALFGMNKDLGQHILKNPGVSQAIVDKANLKQSDVRNWFPFSKFWL